MARLREFPGLAPLVGFGAKPQRFLHHPKEKSPVSEQTALRSTIETSWLRQPERFANRLSHKPICTSYYS